MYHIIVSLAILFTHHAALITSEYGVVALVAANKNFMAIKDARSEIPASHEPEEEGKKSINVYRFKYYERIPMLQRLLKQKDSADQSELERLAEKKDVITDPQSLARYYFKNVWDEPKNEDALEHTDQYQKESRDILEQLKPLFQELWKLIAEKRKKSINVYRFTSYNRIPMLQRLLKQKDSSDQSELERLAEKKDVITDPQSLARYYFKNVWDEPKNEDALEHTDQYQKESQEILKKLKPLFKQLWELIAEKRKKSLSEYGFTKSGGKLDTLTDMVNKPNENYRKIQSLADNYKKEITDPQSLARYYFKTEWNDSTNADALEHIDQYQEKSQEILKKLKPLFKQLWELIAERRK